MKIIFLDYDGVICHVMARLVTNLKTGKASSRGHDPNIMFLLEHLQKKNPDLLYVCSSRAHRRDTKEEQEAVFKNFGFNITFHDDHKTLEPKDPMANRGVAVMNWLEAHPEVENYLMVDDDSDYPPIPEEHFIHVKRGEMSGGLTMEHFLIIANRLDLDFL